MPITIAAGLLSKIEPIHSGLTAISLPRVRTKSANAGIGGVWLRGQYGKGIVR